MKSKNVPAIVIIVVLLAVLGSMALRYRRKLWMREKGDVPFWG